MKISKIYNLTIGEMKSEKINNGVASIAIFFLTPLFFKIGFNYINDIYKFFPVGHIGYWQSFLDVIIITSFRKLIIGK